MTTATATLAGSVWTLLLTTSVANKYRGDFLDSTGQPNSPPLGVDGRTVGYFIAYFGGGRNYSNRLSAGPNATAWSFQVTCAGGTDATALGVVDKVRTVLTGKRVGGGRLLEVGDPGPLRRDETTLPTRMYLPLIFELNVTG